MCTRVDPWNKYFPPTPPTPLPRENSLWDSWKCIFFDTYVKKLDAWDVKL